MAILTCSSVVKPGEIAHYRNDGSAANFNPVLVTNQLSGIQVDILSIPCPVDWDGDGRRDLVVGEWDFNGFANVLLYENTGTPGAPSLSLVTNRLLKRVPRDFTIPTVYDWDCDGQKDLMIGGRTFGSMLFRNTAAAGAFPDSVDTRPAARFPAVDGRRLPPGCGLCRHRWRSQAGCFCRRGRRRD